MIVDGLYLGLLGAHITQNLGRIKVYKRRCDIVGFPEGITLTLPFQNR
jgi:hypothetical protein